MLRDVGDLGPDDHAVLVAQVIEVLRVLVVGQADGVGADLADQVHILLVHLFGQRVADAAAVLMAGHAVQRVLAAVEEEALLGIDAEAAHAEAAADLVHRLAVLDQLQGGGVQVGVLNAVPQVDAGDDQFHVGALAGSDGLAVGVGQGDGDFGVLDVGPALHADLAVLAVHGGGHLEAGAAEVVHIKVILADHHQPGVAVDAAVEGKVGLLGVDAVVAAVVGHDLQGVLVLQQGGDVGAEGGVAAVVVDDLLAVQRNIGRSVDALKLQVDHLGSGVKAGAGKGFGVGAAAAPVVVAAVLAVDVVPGMGHVHGGDGLVRAAETPALVQTDLVAHSFPLLRSAWDSFERHSSLSPNRGSAAPCPGDVQRHGGRRTILNIILIIL